jgi:hypothetical protein
MIDYLLSRLGLHVERRPPPPDGTTRVDDLAGITAIFDRDTARQKSQSFFFGSDGPIRRVSTNDKALGCAPIAADANEWLR